MLPKNVFSIFFVVMFLIGTTFTVQAAPQPETPAVGPVEVSSAVHWDVSGPIRDLPASGTDTAPGAQKYQIPFRQLPITGLSSNQPAADILPPSHPMVGVTASLNFAGVGNGNYGFSPFYVPPDTNGAVGATQYVQWVNVNFAVFNKATGQILPGFPKAGNALWSGFGGGCQFNNDGDPSVQYDKIHNRWIFTQFSVSTTPYLECLAVSTTSDATGSYYRYAFSFGNQFPDYPKLGVWPDGYYMSYNIFNGNSFSGAKVCAMNGAAMRAGTAATQQCFQLNNNYGGLLPSDLDGTKTPPVGSPDFFINFGNNSLNLWKFHVNWSNPANTTFSGPTSISVPAFSPACSGGTCIPQKGTSQQLDSLADRLMYRLAYRNFGDHEAIVATHAVTASPGVGVRWYELRSPNATPSLYQSGTFAPDANYRWMPSIAMDRAGDIAVGYSVSGSSMYPSIRYTGRITTDPLGTMQAENTIKTGGGAQINDISRWGDYSAMSVDPVDDCTFWYTNEYLKTSGSFNWSTQIASFKFNNCTSAPPALTSIIVTPVSAVVHTGKTRQFNASALDQYGHAMNPQPTFNWSVKNTIGTISASGLFTAGSTPGGPYVVSASSGGVSGTAIIMITNLANPVILNGGFELGSLSHWTTSGTTATVSSGAHTGSFAARLGSSLPTNGNSSIVQTFTAPAGSLSLAFWYDVSCPDSVIFDWATATLRDNTTSVTKTILAKTCIGNSGWRQVTSSLTPGHSYSLTLTNWDNNSPGDATYTLFDDVTVQ